MTAADACDLIVDLMRRLSTTAAERDVWRLMFLAQMNHVTELTRELEMTDQRQYICRTRTQDDRDLWLDHADLRRRDRAA